MMRFILDCLRAGRRRAACARENSLELQTKEKEAAAQNEIKELEEVVAMEEGALQKERGVSRDTQQALESLANRRAQLREEIESVQDQRKQEGQLLLSLQEEQEELEQTVQEYQVELQRARDELQILQEEISQTRGRVEDVHGRMAPLKHCIGDTYAEITEAKERLGELIAEMIAIEACVPEITCHQVRETLSVDLEEDEDDDEECYDHVYEDENTITLESEHFDQDQSIEVIEKLQRSAENLKSSGSSSFTEITLTEVKEENASPRSNTPQHMDSPDLEEDFEIVQSLDAKPINQTTSREFDFFHPDPFVEHDVFRDDRFPKVDMTEFLSGDPFKGTDPFASDILYNVAEDHFSQDYDLNEESNAEESDVPYPGPTSKEEHADPSNVVARFSAGANCNQSIDSGMFEQNVPEPCDSEQYTSYSDFCPDVGINITVSMEVNTTRSESDLPASSQLDDGGRFDPIHRESNDIHESLSSDSSTVDSSFDGDFGTFAGTEHPEPEMEADAGPSYVRRNQALYGLQRIDTSSYTSFPLSPDEFAPRPDLPVTNDEEKSIKVADPFSFTSDQDAISELKPEIEAAENCPPVQPGNPTLLCQEFSDTCDIGHTNYASHSAEANDTDAYDHKFGDIYFFTVRLDPGSPDTSPVTAEVSDRKKSECDHTSPESNDAYDFNCGCPEHEDPNQCSLEAYAEESFDKEECAFRRQQPISPEAPQPDMRGPAIEDFPYPKHEQPVQSDSETSSTEDFPYPVTDEPKEPESATKHPIEDFPSSEHNELVQSQFDMRGPIEDCPYPETDDRVQPESDTRYPIENFPYPEHDQPVRSDSETSSPQDFPYPETYKPVEPDFTARHPIEDFPSPEHNEPVQSQFNMRGPIEDCPYPVTDDRVQPKSETMYPIKDFPCPELDETRHPKEDFPYPEHDKPVHSDSETSSPEDFSYPETYKPVEHDSTTRHHIEDFPSPKHNEPVQSDSETSSPEDFPFPETYKPVEHDSTTRHHIEDFPSPKHNEPVQSDSETSSPEDFPYPETYKPVEPGSTTRHHIEDFPSPEHYEPVQSQFDMRGPIEDCPCPELDDPIQPESETMYPIEDFPSPKLDEPVLSQFDMRGLTEDFPFPEIDKPAQSQSETRFPIENFPCSNLDDPVQSQFDMRGQIEDFPCPENAGLDPFGHTVFNLESINALQNTPQKTNDVDLTSTADTNSENCNTGPVIQYLISPVSGDTGMVSADGYKLCTRNPFSFDSGSVEHCDNFESNESFNTKNCSRNESGRCDADQGPLDPFDPVPNDDAIYTFEVKHPNSVNSVSTEGGRLDSGYHENSVLDPFSPALTDTLLSTDMGPSPGLLDLETPDPFSPESNDTMLFDSELCNPSTNDGIMKDSCPLYTAPDVLGDSFSGSELDSFDPFSPVAYVTGGSYIHSNIDILAPGSIQKSNGETRSSSCDSGVSHSPQLHCGSAANREDCPPYLNPEGHHLNYLSNCSTTGSASSIIADADSFQSNAEKIPEETKNSPVAVTGMAELAEIDFFCSELSKMVASRSSDSVQQSVAEMLFGSNPDTAKFYPWDFENSNTESLSPDIDFDSNDKFSKDLPKLEAGARSHRSSDLLGELHSTAGHTLDEDERPSLL